MGPVDEELTAFCRRFVASDASGRSRLRESISLDEFYTLVLFSERCAVFGMRDHQVEHIMDGLTAVAIIQIGRIDYRDALVALGLLNHAAREIGANPDDLFRKVASLAEPTMSNLILGLLKQPPKERDIRRSCGYVMIETEAGPGFVHWGLEAYHPTYPLDKIVLTLAELVKKDKYQPNFIQLGIKLPAVWLSSVDDKLLDKALRSVRAGVSISGKLRPQESQEYQNQHLMIFLVEVKDERAADSLLRLSEEKQNKPNRFVMVSVKKGPLFCLTLEQSDVSGKTPFESPASMQRFSTGITRVLESSVASG